MFYIPIGYSILKQIKNINKPTTHNLLINCRLKDWARLVVSITTFNLALKF